MLFRQEKINQRRGHRMNVKLTFNVSMISLTVKSIKFLDEILNFRQKKVFLMFRLKKRPI